MKSMIITLFVLTAIILSSCAKPQDFPSDPGQAANMAGKASLTAVVTSYGPPTDVFDGGKPILTFDKSTVDLAATVNNFEITASAVQSNGYLWKYGYYLGNDDQWKEFSFSGEPIAGTNWIPASTNRTKALSLTKGSGAEQVSLGDNYIIAYSCKKYSGQWKCGCQSTSGPCNKWMLRSYTLTQQASPPPSTTPPNPPAIAAVPGELPAPADVNFAGIGEDTLSGKPVLKLNGSTQNGALIFEIEAAQTKFEVLTVDAGDSGIPNYFVWNKYYVGTASGWKEKTLEGEPSFSGSSWINKSSNPTSFAININELVPINPDDYRSGLNFVAVYTCGFPATSTFGTTTYTTYRCGDKVVGAQFSSGAGRWRVFGYKYRVGTPPPPGQP